MMFQFLSFCKSTDFRKILLYLYQCTIVNTSTKLYFNNSSPIINNEITLNSNRVSSPLLNVHWTYKRFKNTKLGIYVIEASEKKS